MVSLGLKSLLALEILSAGGVLLKDPFFGLGQVALSLGRRLSDGLGRGLSDGLLGVLFMKFQNDGMSITFPVGVTLKHGRDTVPAARRSPQVLGLAFKVLDLAPAAPYGGTATLEPPSWAETGRACTRILHLTQGRPSPARPAGSLGLAVKVLVLVPRAAS